MAHGPVWLIDHSTTSFSLRAESWSSKKFCRSPLHAVGHLLPLLCDFAVGKGGLEAPVAVNVHSQHLGGAFPTLSFWPDTRFSPGLCSSCVPLHPAPPYTASLCPFKPLPSPGPCSSPSVSKAPVPPRLLPTASAFPEPRSVLGELVGQISPGQTDPHLLAALTVG